MRALLHRYFGTPEFIRLMSIEEYSARQNNQLLEVLPIVRTENGVN